MHYDVYRRRGWPIGSGVTEAGVKQFNQRVKGTAQFWTRDGAEAILALRELWMDQDQRWKRYWATRSAYGLAQASWVEPRAEPEAFAAGCGYNQTLPRGGRGGRAQVQG